MELDRFGFFVYKETIVWSEPGSILRVGTWIVGKTAEADVSANRGEVASEGVNDIVHALIISQLHSRYHDNASISSVPVVISNQRTFGGGTFTIVKLCHAEFDVRLGVERCRVENGYTVPAGLDLDGEMGLEAA